MFENSFCNLPNVARFARQNETFLGSFQSALIVQMECEILFLLVAISGLLMSKLFSLESSRDGVCMLRFLIQCVLVHAAVTSPTP